MRMSAAGLIAADVVNRADEATLADDPVPLRRGARRRAASPARSSSAARAPRSRRTGELAALVAGVLGRQRGRIDPATRTFQALRIHVNDELGELERALAAAQSLLAPGGRLVVVAFHSLEDRLVKRFLAARSGRQAAAVAPSARARPAAPQPLFRPLSGRAIRPGPAEIAANPRARSARLRAAERLRRAPAHEDTP